MNRAVPGHPVFSIMEGTCISISSGACSKSGSRKEAVLSLNIQRGLIHRVPQKIPKRWRPAQLLTECGCSYHVLLVETGLQVCVIFCPSTDCLSRRNPSRSCGSRLTPFSTCRQSCSPAASLFILVIISCNWLSISLRDSCLLLPCQRWLFPRPEERRWGWACPAEGVSGCFLRCRRLGEKQPS